MVNVYILKLSNGNFYCGITQDLEKRMLQHHSGKSKYTSRFLPLLLVWSIVKENRKVARDMEVRIKNEGVKRWLVKNHLECLSSVTK